MRPKRTVVLVGMPRSGTSWLSQIVESSPDVRFRLSPLFAYAFKNRLDATAGAEEWRALFREAYRRQDDEFMEQRTRRASGQYPTFEDEGAEPPVLAIKMTRFHHLLEPLLEQVPEVRVAAIVRHPCGAIHSWLTTPDEFPADADPLAEWRSGACRKSGPEEFWGFDDWVSVTRLHLDLRRRYPQRVHLLRYEDLVDDVVATSEELFEFLDLRAGAETRRFLEASQARHDAGSHAVFKDPAVKDRWRRELQSEIRDAILAGIDRDGDDELAEFAR